MIEKLSGVVLDLEDARYALAAFDELLRGRRPSARLADFIARLRKTVKSGVSDAKSGVCLSPVPEKFGAQHVSGHTAPYDLLDTREAAAVLGITPNAVRDLRRRGRLPAHKAGGRWLYPAASVVARAERRAAHKAD